MIKKIILLTLIITTAIPTFFYGMPVPDIPYIPWDFAFDCFGVLHRLDKDKANHYYKSEEWSPYSSPMSSPSRAKRSSGSYKPFSLMGQNPYTNSPHFEAEALLGCPVWAAAEKEHISPKEIARHSTGTRRLYLSAEEQAQLEGASSDFIENIAHFVHPIKSGMRIFQLLKQNGCRSFILSNIPYECNQGMHSQQFLERCQREIPGYIDPFSTSVKEIYSIHAKSRKPEPEIYRLLLESGQLSPRRVFIDDSLKNVMAAADAGIFSISCCTHAELYFTLLTLGFINRDEIEEFLLNDEEELKILRKLQYGEGTMPLTFYISALLLALSQDVTTTFMPSEGCSTSDALNQALIDLPCETILKCLACVFKHPTTYGDPTLAYQFADQRRAERMAEATESESDTPAHETLPDLSSWLSPV